LIFERFDPRFDIVLANGKPRTPDEIVVEASKLGLLAPTTPARQLYTALIEIHRAEHAASGASRRSCKIPIDASASTSPPTIGLMPQTGNHASNRILTPTRWC
jgi:hypothetical protein